MITNTNKQNTQSIGTEISTLYQVMLLVLFAGLLSIPFLEHDRYYLAWIAFVPLLFAIENTSLKKVYGLSLFAGLCLFILATHWVPAYAINAKGVDGSTSLFLSFAMWFCSAQLIACSMLVFKWLSRSTGVHEFILFPVVLTVFSAAFPVLFAMHLGESQVNNAYALQAIEFTGVYGLDAIIALFNILAFRFIYNFSNGLAFTKSAKRSSWFFSLGLILVWMLYGLIAHHSWSEQIDSWQTSKIGLVQPNENPILGKTLRYPYYSKAYPPEMEMTTRLSELGAELIIWPEAQTKDYLNNPNVKNAYSQSIKELQTSLLFQDKQKVSESDYSEKHYNMAILLNAQGSEVDTYQKMQRIPFGEYIPIVENSSYLQSKTQKHLGKSKNELIAGDSHQIFKHASVNIIPLICYETTSPMFVANAVKHTSHLANKANGTLLVGLSNDGWFKSLSQTKLHVLPSVLRAVENRLPLVHVVNNGPSIVVMPNGEKIFISAYQQAGGYLVDVPYSNELKGSFYSRHPRLFIYVLYCIFIFFFGQALWASLKRKTD